jgi:hypothetical protein
MDCPTNNLHHVGGGTIERKEGMMQTVIDIYIIAISFALGVMTGVNLMARRYRRRTTRRSPAKLSNSWRRETANDVVLVAFGLHLGK